MRTRIITYIILLGLSALSSQAQSPAVVQAYIAQHKATAIQFEKEYGIPAAITLAQAILESGAGTSSLTKACNNHFCIKSGSSWTGPVYLAWDDESTKSRFRSYSSAQESFRDYARLISSSRTYRSLFNISVYDYRGWANGLKKCGYATAPHYANALIGIIDHYRLYTLNGGVKLRPGKTVVITKVVEDQAPVFDHECVLADDETTEEETNIAQAMSYEAVMINRVDCTVIHPGEDLASVARKHDIAPADLLRFNDVVKASQLQEGDVVFLAKKKKRFEGAQDVYQVVSDQESLHSVAQRFGVQLQALAKINNADPYALLHAGDTVLLK